MTFGERLYNSKKQAYKPVDAPWSKAPFHLVHTDLMGPFKVESIGCKKYMISLIDDLTRYEEVKFLFKKSDASWVLQTFCEKIKTQTNRYPTSLHSDQGGKYINTELTDYFESKYCSRICVCEDSMYTNINMNISIYGIALNQCSM